MIKCGQEECSNRTYDEKYCILHCEKPDYNSKEIETAFIASLIELISEKSSRVRTYLTQSPSKTVPSLISTTFFLKNIAFPQVNPVDGCYSDILGKLKYIKFVGCSFKGLSLTFIETECAFYSCTFHSIWELSNIPILKSQQGVLFHKCIFKENVHTDWGPNRKLDIPFFKDCNFQKGLELISVILDKPLFTNSEGINDLSLSTLKISQCEINSSFILNGHKIGKLLINDSIFTAKFELKENNIDEFSIDNTNYKKLVDAYKTKFGSFSIEKSIFDDFVGFEKCVCSPNEQASLFRYATFLSFVNFRGAKFLSGLDIKNINLKESPNFLEVEVSNNNTPRETFRIIKHSFEKIGNNIEANKYFAIEMKKYSSELTFKNHLSEKTILTLNGLISNYGQSYVKPIAWIIITATLYSWIVNSNVSLWLTEQFPSLNYCLNSGAKNILPFGKFLKENLEFISLLFYILFTSLIWQTIVAIKRHTKK